MHHLLAIADLAPADVARILARARELQSAPPPSLAGRACVYSFEGNSLRTRATFLKAMAALKLTAIELPNLLKTAEDKRHLAGYLDQWAEGYVIRESNHEALEAFARASRRPVINAMSAQGHPCEVLGDAFWLEQHFGDLRRLRVTLVGPATNVLRSWAELCALLGIAAAHACPPGYAPLEGVRAAQTLDEALVGANAVFTDAWPAGFDDPAYRVTLAALERAAPDAVVIPCPPFNTAREVAPEVIASPRFAGYAQKAGLYHVQMAILALLL